MNAKLKNIHPGEVLLEEKKNSIRSQLTKIKNLTKPKSTPSEREFLLACFSGTKETPTR